MNPNSSLTSPDFEYDRAKTKRPEKSYLIVARVTQEDIRRGAGGRARGLTHSECQLSLLFPDMPGSCLRSDTILLLSDSLWSKLRSPILFISQSASCLVHARAPLCRWKGCSRSTYLRRTPAGQPVTRRCLTSWSAVSVNRACALGLPRWGPSSHPGLPGALGSVAQRVAQTLGLQPSSRLPAPHSDPRGVSSASGGRRSVTKSHSSASCFSISLVSYFPVSRKLLPEGRAGEGDAQG